MCHRAPSEPAQEAGHWQARPEQQRSTRTSAEHEDSAEHWQHDHQQDGTWGDETAEEQLPPAAEAWAQHQHEGAEGWEQPQQQHEKHAGGWDHEQDPWGEEGPDEAELSADMAGMHLAQHAQQPETAWQPVEPAPSSDRPPVGSHLCPDHFRSGECQNDACELVHGHHCEVGSPWLQALDHVSPRPYHLKQCCLGALLALSARLDTYTCELRSHRAGRTVRCAQTCGRFALDPSDEKAWTSHAEGCLLRWRRFTSQQMSAQMECCMCGQRCAVLCWLPVPASAADLGVCCSCLEVDPVLACITPRVKGARHCVGCARRSQATVGSRKHMMPCDESTLLWPGDRSKR